LPPVRSIGSFYPDVIFGAGKIVMQTLRLPLARLSELGVEPRDIRSVALVFDSAAVRRPLRRRFASVQLISHF